MTSKKSRSIWCIADEYDNMQFEYIKSPRMYGYLNLMRTELIEIIFQLESLNNLTGYKINSLSRYKKTKYIVIRTCKEFFFSLNLKRRKFNIKLNELVFFVEFDNHYKQYLGLKIILDQQCVDHTVIFLDKKVFLRYEKSVKNSYYIGRLFSNIGLVKSLLKLITVNFKIIFDKNIRNISAKNSSTIKLELLFYNSKHLLENYNISFALNKVINTKIKRAIFFKAEGFKIRNIIDVFFKKDINTIAIQHGLIVENIKFNNLNINKYYVWSDVFADKLNACNATCDTVSLGCPDYDKHAKHLFTDELSHEDNITRFLFLPNSGKSQTPESEILFALKICLKYLSKNSDFQLVIKPHPGGDIQLIKNVVGSFDICDVIVLEKEHKLNYNIYDIVVTMNSTVGIESAIFRKPLIVILSSLKMMMINDYMNYKIAEFVTSDNEMKEAVTKIKDNYNIYQKRCDIFINDYLTNLGTSAKQIVKNLLADV
jgi:hypothetical protein